MSGPSWSMSWKYWGHFDIGSCQCQRGIQSHSITLSRCTMTFWIIWTVMRALAKKKTSCKEELFFTVKLARQKLSRYNTEVTPTTVMLFISANILDPFWILRLLTKWDNGLHINPQDKTFYTTQYQEAFLKYVENEYCAKHGRVPVNKNESFPSRDFILSATSSGSCQWTFDWYDLANDDKEYLTPNNVAEMTPGRSYCAARLLAAAWLYSHSPPEAPKNWRWINPNLNAYHSNPTRIIQYILVTGHHLLVASTEGNTLKVRRSFQCGARHILYHTTLCWIGGQFFRWPRC